MIAHEIVDFRHLAIDAEDVAADGVKTEPGRQRVEKLERSTGRTHSIAPQPSDRRCYEGATRAQNGLGP
jgi:hypothetical protein